MVAPMSARLMLGRGVCGEGGRWARRCCGGHAPAVVGDENVAALDVAVRDALRVEVLEPEQYLPRVDLDDGLLEAPEPLDQRTDRPAGHELEENGKLLAGALCAEVLDDVVVAESWRIGGRGERGEGRGGVMLAGPGNSAAAALPPAGAPAPPPRRAAAAPTRNPPWSISTSFCSACSSRVETSDVSMYLTAMSSPESRLRPSTTFPKAPWPSTSPRCHRIGGLREVSVRSFVVVAVVEGSRGRA